MPLVPSPLKLAPLAEGEKLTPLHMLAVRADGLSFLQCVSSAVRAPAIVEKFDRLTGSGFSGRGVSRIAQLIDEATGKTDAELAKFLSFVWDVGFCRA